ncbi:iron-containing alcohol dehydrogenase family protein [Promethearchaeum syntrophicum]|uniref:Iron-containing alcohol dehydrogenase family protein n=1 Tax=Promethearchaeum syntrophicum TaxID=2594042 RepID=A0A5B9D836_9ARCH|nr:iron-containing alcohol dehydrogenase [Candidatus Prometheoarchaeum syntrophicum]QEE15171.1 L-1,2-propanediol oxidoreductase [Candidatus Prometheoarchaeum syntrophicum]
MEESGKKMNEEINKEPDNQKDTDLDLENSEKEIEKQEKILTEKIQIKQEKSEELEKLPLPHIRWEDVVFSFPQPKIEFGKGVVKNVPKAIFNLLDPTLLHIKKAEIKRPKILIIIGHESVKKSGSLDKILQSCENNNIETIVFSCGKGEADVTMVNEAVEMALEEKVHFIVGIGGGSVMDVAKATAGIVTNGGLAEDYHEGKPFELPGLPFIAIPTTAGTGTEITNNAVLIDKTRGHKKSIRGSNLMSKYILLDPELSLKCPPEITASSGADALVQAIESYVSIKSHPLADIYALEAIFLILPNLRTVFDNGEDYAARSEMLLGSFFAGIALSNVGLGLVHGLAHPIGYKYNLPHGKVCGALLPYVIEYNLEYRADKYARIGRIFSQLDLFTKYEPEATDEKNSQRLASMIKELFSQIQIPLKLRDLGVLKEDFDWIIENTKGGSVNSNPRKPDPESLRELLEKAW